MQNRGFLAKNQKSVPHKQFCTPYINLLYAHFARRSLAICIKLPVCPLFSHFFKICGRLAKNPTVWRLFGSFSAFLCHLSPKHDFWLLFPSVHSDFRHFGQFCLYLSSFLAVLRLSCLFDGFLRLFATIWGISDHSQAIYAIFGAL